MNSVKGYLQQKENLVNSFLESYLIKPFSPGVLHDAMKYSLLAGGKRIRPILCLTAYEACGGHGEDILPQACAIELIHTYSLIHDDLPAMDNDDLRRGKPTSHIMFGEAMAILAGDALLTDAFRIFSQNNNIPTGRLLSGIHELASAAGVMGMVAGQAQDIISEKLTPDKDTVNFIHSSKTAALIRASAKIGAILSDADTDTITHIAVYGEKIGLAFQVIDDVLDIESSTEELGKPSGSDKKSHKMTYPSVYGTKESKNIAGGLIEDAVRSIKKINGNPDTLVSIAGYLLTRTS
ncbi:MAG TPA: polyprenyl synthetase family protein [Nitrospirae bacterium]|nr:polyprenyl synthetase family protein [Nitrospirota bacterium]